jgi:hypothetical protein
MNAGDPFRCSSEGQPVDIRERNFTGSARESELPIVPLASQGQHNLGRGKGQYFYHVSEEVKEGDCTERAGNSRKGLGTSEETIPEGQAGVNCESHWKKMIGKPYSGKPNVRFDEGELEIELAATTPALYSTEVANEKST